MALPAAGQPISFSQINVELGDGATDTIDLKAASETFGETAPFGMDELAGLSNALPTITSFAVATNNSVAGRLDLTWDFSVGTGVPAISAIAIKRSSASDMGSPATISTVDDDAHSDTGQGNNATRYYQADVTNAVGTRQSSIVNATTLALPTFSSFAAAEGSDSGEIDVSWGTSGVVDSFVVKYSTNSDMSSATNLSTTNDGAETQGSITAATMYYQGTAINDAGSTNSSIVSASPPGTAWSDLTGDPQNLVGAEGGSDVSNACSIVLGAGTGNTTIGGSLSGGVVGTLYVAYSTSGDPGTGGLDNSGSGFLSIGSRTLSFTSGTLYFRTKFTHTSGKDSSGGYVVTFTNNSVANNDMNGTLNFSL
jgi:hypothetical protein